MARMARAIDVAAAAGALARAQETYEHAPGHGVGLAREDVALLEPALRGQVEVAAAVRADRAEPPVDVALEPGRVDRLDEELLADVEGQGEAEPPCAGRTVDSS